MLHIAQFYSISNSKYNLYKVYFFFEKKLLMILLHFSHRSNKLNKELFLEVVCNCYKT